MSIEAHVSDALRSACSSMGQVSWGTLPEVLGVSCPCRVGGHELNLTQPFAVVADDPAHTIGDLVAVARTLRMLVRGAAVADLVGVGILPRSIEARLPPHLRSRLSMWIRGGTSSQERGAWLHELDLWAEDDGVHRGERLELPVVAPISRRIEYRHVLRGPWLWTSCVEPPEEAFPIGQGERGARPYLAVPAGRLASVQLVLEGAAQHRGRSRARVWLRKGVVDSTAAVLDALAGISVVRSVVELDEISRARLAADPKTLQQVHQALRWHMRQERPWHWWSSAPREAPVALQRVACAIAAETALVEHADGRLRPAATFVVLDDREGVLDAAALLTLSDLVHRLRDARRPTPVSVVVVVGSQASGALGDIGSAVRR